MDVIPVGSDGPETISVGSDGPETISVDLDGDETRIGRTGPEAGRRDPRSLLTCVIHASDAAVGLR